MAFKKAQRRKAKARIGLVGPAGSGKTYSALQLAFGLAPGGKIAVIDTEHGSADLYAHLGDYDTAQVTPPYTVQKYLALLKEAEQAGYDVVIIDSLSHAWSGEGGLLDQVDKIASAKKNSFTAWRDVTPQHNRLVDAMLQSPAHIIATMRAKTEYVLTEQNGKKVPQKVGMAPVQREGMDYEFTLVFDLDQERHLARTSKDRTSLFDGFCDVLTVEHGRKIRKWLDSGVEAPKNLVDAVEVLRHPKEVKPKPKKADPVATVLALAQEQGLTESDLLDYVRAAPGETLADLGTDVLRELYRDLQAGAVPRMDAVTDEEAEAV